MARHLIRLSGGEHMVIDDSTPPLGTGFLPESVYDGAAAPSTLTLSTYTLAALPIETVNALKSATTILTQ